MDMDRLITGQKVTVTGSPTRTTGRSGAATVVGVGQQLTVPDPFGAQGRGSMVVALRVRTPLAGAWPATGWNVGNSLDDSTRWGCHLPYGEDGIVYFDITNVGNRITYSGHTWGAWDVWGFSNGPTNGKQIWLNGLSVSSSTETTSRSAAATTWGPGQHAGTTNGNDGEVAFLGTWNRELAPAEIASLAVDPYNMFVAW